LNFFGVLFIPVEEAGQGDCVAKVFIFEVRGDGEEAGEMVT